MAAHDACEFGQPAEPIRFDARDLDLAASPRADLDAFVNARWRALHPVPPDRSSWDGFAILAERAARAEAEIAAAAAARGDATDVERIVRDFWTTGMHVPLDAGRARLDRELARIEKLAVPEDIAAYLRARHAEGADLVFRFDVEPDPDDPARMTACLVQGGLGLPDRDGYFDASVNGTALLDAYRSHAAALLELAGADAASALRGADAVLAFETRLAFVSRSRRELARDVGARFRMVDVETAERETPGFSWRAYFEALGVDVPLRFSLAMPEFHAEAARMLADADPAVWRAYLRVRTIDDAAPYAGEALARQHHAFHAGVLRGQKSMKPRWKRTVEAIDAHVGEAMGRLYVARTFAPESKRAVCRLVGRLRAALRERLSRCAWMSETTRAAALAKLDALDVKIGYPDRWRDWSDFETSRESLYANVLAARAFERRRRARMVGKPVDRALWPFPPQAVNAGYDPQRNEIVFPAAILAPPFFDPAADAALNYGGIGAVIAHEMIHGYDDQGSRFGADGRFANWWADADRARFEAEAAKLVAQFDALREQGERIDGRLTLGENIADFGGLAVAFDALTRALEADDRPDPLIDGYTQPQRFFFAWASLWRQSLTPDEARFRLAHDTHAPASARANAAPSNLPGYADAFGVQPGDPMWRSREDAVRIW